MRKIINLTAFVVILCLIIGINAAMTPAANAQAGVSTGSIQGTILDPNGATVGGAKVTITSKGTGAKVTPEVSSAGTYNSGPLVPGGIRVVRVEAAGFRAIEETLTVQVGNITPGTLMTLELGSGNTIITVEGSAVNVDTEQTTIQGVVTSDQIENLPINGRNFLDLAQLEPGVQIQDGGNFDPTKKGFSSISFGGRFGRTARIEVDGLDISDETVGTTTQNIGVNSIKEFQVSQSESRYLDRADFFGKFSVNITTNSGTNTEFMARGFSTIAAMAHRRRLEIRLLNSLESSMEQISVGRLSSDKLLRLWFLGKNHAGFGVASGAPEAPFNDLRSTFNAPFREIKNTLAVWTTHVTNNIHAFFKFAYEQNLGCGDLYSRDLSIIWQTWISHRRAGGGCGHHARSLDAHFPRGLFCEEFRNTGITDAVTGSSIF